MSRPETDQLKSKRMVTRSRVLTALTACGVLVVASMVGLALGANSKTTALHSRVDASIGESILLDSHGQTLYALSPESTHHLLCTSGECLKAWPPLTVHSSKTKLKAPRGVHGHLAILRRANGVLQVTLGGSPLYRFSGDQKGTASGQGIKSFGGTWHVVSTGSLTAPPSTSSTSSTPSATTPSSTETTTSATATTTTSTTTTQTSSSQEPYGY